jgi:hypothetical protein
MFGGDGGQLPQSLEKMIDDAVGLDFEVHQLTEEDRQNEFYKALVFALRCSRTPILYERAVISDQTPVVPRLQFLFAVRPTGNLCFFTQKQSHKRVLCNESNLRNCFLIQGLMYLLVESERFAVWSYAPQCCTTEENCPLSTLGLELRRTLFSEE